MQQEISNSWHPEYHNLWPTPETEWLLRAALTHEPEFAEFFSKWRKEAGFTNYDEIDYATCRILPMLYKQFRRAGMDDAWLGNMRSLHRYHWATIKSKQRYLANLVENFSRAGIASVVLKGNALIAGGYFDDAGERPLNDLDVLIQPADEEAAGELLRATNWAKVDTGLHAESHACVWQNADGVVLDLHRKLFQPPYSFVGLNSLLPESKEAILCGMPVQIPDATHLLMHCLVHGRVCWGSVRHPFLWVADAIRILERAPDGIDWVKLREDAERFAIVFDIRESLGYLRAKFDAPIPDNVLQELMEIVVSREEMLPFFRWTNEHEIHSLLELKDFMYADFLCRQQMADRPPTTSSYLHYACARMHRLLTTGAGCRRLRFLGIKLRYGGLLATIRRPDYFRTTTGE